jgi:hypothetical protein
VGELFKGCLAFRKMFALEFAHAFKDFFHGCWFGLLVVVVLVVNLVNLLRFRDF